MLKQIEVFVLLLIVWVLLVWPFDAGTQHILWEDVAIGAIAALAAAALMRTHRASGLRVWLSPVRLFWLLIYIGALAWYVIKANLDVAYRVLHPDMPINPGIVKVRTKLTTPWAITLLANSITLTPGTLTVNALSDGTLYIHWIYVRSDDATEATERIVKRFEWFVERIFAQGGQA